MIARISVAATTGSTITSNAMRGKIPPMASRTFVAATPTQAHICGYFTLSAAAVALADFPEAARKGWPRLVPTVHLGRLAVDNEFQGQGLGNALMRSAMQMALDAAELIGISTVELWAIDEAAIAYYSRFGFVALLDDPLISISPCSKCASFLNSKCP